MNWPNAPGGVPTMDVNDNAGSLNASVVWASIASLLAKNLRQPPFLLATLTLSLGSGSMDPNRARSSGAGSVRHYVRAFLFMEHGSCLS